MMCNARSMGTADSVAVKTKELPLYSFENEIPFRISVY